MLNLLQWEHNINVFYHIVFHICVFIYALTLQIGEYSSEKFSFLCILNRNCLLFSLPFGFYSNYLNTLSNYCNTIQFKTVNQCWILLVCWCSFNEGCLLLIHVILLFILHFALIFNALCLCGISQNFSRKSGCHRLPKFSRSRQLTKFT